MAGVWRRGTIQQPLSVLPLLCPRYILKRLVFQFWSFPMEKLGSRPSSLFKIISKASFFLVCGIKYDIPEGRLRESNILFLYIDLAKHRNQAHQFPPMPHHVLPFKTMPSLILAFLSPLSVIRKLFQNLVTELVKCCPLIPK